MVSDTYRLRRERKTGSWLLVHGVKSRPVKNDMQYACVLQNQPIDSATKQVTSLHHLLTFASYKSIFSSPLWRFLMSYVQSSFFDLTFLYVKPSLRRVFVNEVLFQNFRFFVYRKPFLGVFIWANVFKACLLFFAVWQRWRCRVWVDRG